MNRRHLLKAALAGAAFTSLPLFRSIAAPPLALEVDTRILDVNGKAATVYSLLGPSGRPGLTFDAGSDFDVALRNSLSEPTMIHWHGLTPPWRQDGAPGMPMPLLEPGETRNYHFPVGQGGTHWMHAHTLQEQNLLAAPLIVRTAEDRSADEQEVTVLLHDFSFTPAAELLARLAGDGVQRMAGMNNGAMMGGMTQSQMNMGSTSMAGLGMRGMGHGAMHGTAQMDLNDIDYDAYLANDRTLDDPETHRVEKGGIVRLRVINGASSTVFTLDLGLLEGELVAVDGQPVLPAQGRRFPLASGQRVDVRLRIPSEGGSFPILALREGAPERTGIVLATRGATVAMVEPAGDRPGPTFDLALEAGLRAAKPLPIRTPDRSAVAHLTGDMISYKWHITGMEGFEVRQGERIEITMVNMSMMAHPMHLHGHHFQIVAIDGNRLAGAVRDTILVPPMRAVTVAVNADNPGRWAFHCHHLYHMESGMMSHFVYDEMA